MPAINFFTEDTDHKLKDKTAIRKWITQAIKNEGFKLDELNYIFCSDAYLLQMNQQYLDHDTYTDVITFDNSDQEGRITGDIFISADRIEENALKFGVTPAQEMHRVMIHGALHLLGYKDKTPADKQKMTLKEDQYLALRDFNV